MCAHLYRQVKNSKISIGISVILVLSLVAMAVVLYALENATKGIKLYTQERVTSSVIVENQVNV